MQCPKPQRIVDPAYRRSARAHLCDVPDCDAHGDTGTVVLAHIRLAGNSGTGLKPSDDESLFLCFDHHADYDASPNRCEWIVRMIVIPLRQLNYRGWAAENGRARG